MAYFIKYYIPLMELERYEYSKSDFLMELERYRYSEIARKLKCYQNQTALFLE